MGRNGRRLQSFRRFDVADDQCGMKVGTDALVLGCWAGENLQGVTRILDVGTGSGILALMLAQRHNQAVVEAVELEPDAARQAAENVTASPFGSRVSVHEMAVQAWVGADVDLVVCNPPFFHNHPKSPERKRNLARHDDTLPLRVLFAEAHRVTHESGVFQFVFPTEREVEVRAAGTEEGWRLSERISLRWSAAHEPIRDLWTWVKHANVEHPPTEEERLIHDIEQGSWAPWLKDRLSAFLNEA